MFLKDLNRHMEAAKLDKYNKFTISPLQFATRNDLRFLEGNVIKYLMRNLVRPSITDVLKAGHYLREIYDDTRERIETVQGLQPERDDETKDNGETGPIFWTVDSEHDARGTQPWEGRKPSSEAICWTCREFVKPGTICLVDRKGRPVCNKCGEMLYKRRPSADEQRSELVFARFATRD